MKIIETLKHQNIKTLKCVAAREDKMFLDKTKNMPNGLNSPLARAKKSKKKKKPKQIEDEKQ